MLLELIPLNLHLPYTSHDGEKSRKRRRNTTRGRYLLLGFGMGRHWSSREAWVRLAGGSDVFG